MGLTRAECKSLGIEHLYPDARSDEAIIRELAGERADEEWPTRDLSGKPPPLKKEPGDGYNKTERAFAADLSEAHRNGSIAAWWREPFKVRLAGRTWYTPDFAVLTIPAHQSLMLMFEVKGWMRDDAAVKLKVAAETYPCFRWLLVTRSVRHGWEVRQVTRTGIGREPVVVPWIGGYG